MKDVNDVLDSINKKNSEIENKIDNINNSVLDNVDNIITNSNTNANTNSNIDTNINRNIETNTIFLGYASLSNEEIENSIILLKEAWKL